MDRPCSFALLRLRDWSLDPSERSEGMEKIWGIELGALLVAGRRDGFTPKSQTRENGQVRKQANEQMSSFKVL